MTFVAFVHSLRFLVLCVDLASLKGAEGTPQRPNAICASVSPLSLDRVNILGSISVCGLQLKKLRQIQVSLVLL